MLIISAPRQQRHSHMNDIIWRAIKRVQMSAVKEPVSLTLEDNKRPDGTTLLPWAKGMAWDWLGMSQSLTPIQSHDGESPGSGKQNRCSSVCSLNAVNDEAELTCSGRVHVPKGLDVKRCRRMRRKKRRKHCAPITLSWLTTSFRRTSPNISSIFTTAETRSVYLRFPSPFLFFNDLRVFGAI